MSNFPKHASNDHPHTFCYTFTLLHPQLSDMKLLSMSVKLNWDSSSQPKACCACWILIIPILLSFIIVSHIYSYDTSCETMISSRVYYGNFDVEQVRDELYNHRKPAIKITSDSMCSLCKKKIGTSVFAVYPNGKTLVHFVCFRDSQNMKAVSKDSPIRRRT